MIQAPLLNPIRFYTGLPDYSSSFPNMDNVTQRTMYIDGIHAAQYYKEWLLGKDIILQFEYEQGDNTDLKVYKYSQNTETYSLISTNLGVDVTPAGWIGNNYVKHTLTLLEGTYYLEFSDGYKSDIFTVINSTRLQKKLVEIVYTNSENDFGVILEDQTFRNYFCGQLVIGNPENEISGFESDRGELIKLSSTPKRIATLHINELHYTYVDHVNMIFSLDNITINGVTYQNTEPPTVDDIEYSDLKDVTIKLVQTNNNYFYAR